MVNAVSRGSVICREEFPGEFHRGAVGSAVVIDYLVQVFLGLVAVTFHELYLAQFVERIGYFTVVRVLGKQHGEGLSR